MHVCCDVCVYVCVHEYMYACMFVCMYVCVLVLFPFSCCEGFLASVLQQGVMTPALTPLTDVILALSYQVVQNVDPNVPQGDSMDVLQYVKINCVPGRRLEECEYVFGAVIPRNVSHKKMLQEIHNPRILLLKSALELRFPPSTLPGACIPVFMPFVSIMWWLVCAKNVFHISSECCVWICGCLDCHLCLLPY